VCKHCEQGTPLAEYCVQALRCMEAVHPVFFMHEVHYVQAVDAGYCGHAMHCLEAVHAVYCVHPVHAVYYVHALDAV